MLKVSRAAALATVLGGLALAAPAFAAPFNDTTAGGPPTSSINMDSSGNVVNETTDTSEGQSSDTMPVHHHHHHHGASTATTSTTAPAANSTTAAVTKTASHSPEDMRKHVEDRIKELHSKLGITADEESQWTDVAQAMRDSEATTISLIQDRHQNAKTMNAVDDLESYQKISQAHADGLKNVASAFNTLYGNMPDAQKVNADKVFGTYEGAPERMSHHIKTSK